MHETLCCVAVVVHVSLEGQIKEVMHKAFWDSLAESLREDPPNYTHALVLLKEVKEVVTETSFVHFSVFVLRP